MDILKQLGVDFSYGKLESWLGFYIRDYVMCKERFDEALRHVNAAFSDREEAQAVARFVKPFEGYYEEQLEMYSAIDKLIKENTSESWSFSHIEIEQEDVNEDPYYDFVRLSDVLYVYAYTKGVSKTETLAQKSAIAEVEATRRDLDMAISSLKHHLIKLGVNENEI